jgi:hypothetical protein
VKKKSVKRQRRKVGAFVKIRLDRRWHSYARILDEAVFAFYDSRADKELSIDEICSKPILFKIPVMNSAVTRGRWKIIGYLSLEPELKELPKFFIQDELDPAKFFIYHKGEAYPVTREECEGLEREAVWDAEHVEDRLRDYYKGVPNRIVESLKIKD